MNTRIIESEAKLVSIIHPEHSYGRFIYTEDGAFFLDSDWGFYGHRWSNPGQPMVDFLISIDDEYFIKKLEINHFNETGKKIAPIRKEKIKELFKEFQLHLKARGNE